MTLSHDSILSDHIIRLAIAVHRQLGPGLLESAYEECLCFELKENDIAYQRQASLPVVYKTVRLDCGYRMDIVVEGKLILEIKSVERLLPIHEAQMLTYLRLSGLRLSGLRLSGLRLSGLKVGLLMNFNTVVLKDGLRRFML